MGSLLAFDPAKRRPRATRPITPAYEQRLRYANRLAELEFERSELRERLRHVVEGSEVKTTLLIDLACIQGDIELIEELLAETGNVVSIGGRR